MPNCNGIDCLNAYLGSGEVFCEVNMEIKGKVQESTLQMRLF